MPITIYKYSRPELEKSGFNDENILHLKNNYFICVNATGNIHSVPYFKKEHNNVLNIQFDDTDVDQYKSCPSVTHGEEDIVYLAKACTEELALEVKRFIDKIPSNAVVHVICTKGKSRSTAISNFISEYRNNESKIYEDYNIFVYNLLMKVKDD